MGQARRDDVGDGMTDETQSPASETSLHALVEEASRQLTICNACRYCEGFCAVFPALERRTVLSAGDVIQLANLCHDCRACLDACMYSPPHEFAVSPPPVLSATRLASYDRYAWPRSMPRVLRGRVGLFFGAVLCAIVLRRPGGRHQGRGRTHCRTEGYVLAVRRDLLPGAARDHARAVRLRPGGVRHMRPGPTGAMSAAGGLT